MRNKANLLIALTTALLLSCSTASAKSSKAPVDRIIAELNNPAGKQVIVVAHRADWRNHPENSISSIKSCIEMGVDMVELDVRKTKDGVFILMHDGSINRTTTGKGSVSSLTLKEIKSFYLKEGKGGAPTKEKVPTLEETLKVCKGRIMINIDKAGITPELLELMKKTGTTKQILFKSGGAVDKINKTLSQYKKEAKQIHFMPIVSRGGADAVKKYLDLKVQPKAVELIFSNGNSAFNQAETLAEIEKMGMRRWINTLWSSLCGGQTDDKAHKDPEVWGRLIEKGYNIIQTDRPQELLNYLNSKGLHKFNRPKTKKRR